MLQVATLDMVREHQARLGADPRDPATGHRIRLIAARREARRERLVGLARRALAWLRRPAAPRPRIASSPR